LLQLATIPFWFLLLLLGGVGLPQIIQVVVITLATTFSAGSLGGLIALWRERTFPALALTVLFLVMYIVLAWSLPGVAGLLPGSWSASARQIQEVIEPFSALAGVHRGMWGGSDGMGPGYAFAIFMIGLGLLLNLFGIWKLRVWNPSGEPIMQREKTEDAEDPEGKLAGVSSGVGAGRVSVHAAPGAARPVLGNPILWREVATRAYGRRPILIKLAYFFVLLLIAYPVMMPVMLGQDRSNFLAAIGLLSVGVLSLLLVTAQATTSITSERDTGALDLLLVTDLTAHEFIFGKILGILYNTKEYLLPPFLLAGFYGLYGCLATAPKGHADLSGSMNAMALLCVIATCAVLIAFATILGIHVALRTTNSQVAIIHSLSTIFFLTVGTLVCIVLILINRQFEYQWGSFIFFLIAGIGGLWYVLNSDRPTAALSWASWFCPLAVLYSIMTIVVGRPGSQESADPVIPALVMGASFGFAIAAMLVPLLSEFDVAMGRTSGGAD
ncbi:MAG: ABC transporter permease, partial [Gemmataceae bacterium]